MALYPGGRVTLDKHETHQTVTDDAGVTVTSGGQRAVTAETNVTWLLSTCFTCNNAGDTKTNGKITQ